MILHIEPATPLNERSGKPMPERELENVAPYPKFGVTVTKWRKLPRTPENIEAHFEALMGQLHSLQRSEFRRKITEPDRCPCASGTWHADGDKILKAVNEQNRRALDGAVADSWKKRTDAQVEIAYRAAMEGREAPLTVNIYVPGGRH